MTQEMSRVCLEDFRPHGIGNDTNDFGTPRDSVIVLGAGVTDTVELSAIYHQTGCMWYVESPVEVGIDCASDGVLYTLHAVLYSCLVDPSPCSILSILFSQSQRDAKIGDRDVCVQRTGTALGEIGPCRDCG